MKRLLALLLAGLFIAVPISAARGGPSRPIAVYVVVPSVYTSTVTPGQAESAVRAWLGSPSDAPCTGSTSCTIEGWFRAELGQVFDYTVTVVNTGLELTSGLDACGQGGSGLGVAVPGAIEHAGYPVRNTRFFALVMGAGGWAGHVFSTKGNGDKFAIGGDWGVMEQFGVRNSCIPDWDYPNRGFSHEFAGMLGMFVGGGCYEDGMGCYIGDSMSATEKAALLKYSGGWLRNP